jgi:signal transduction histidine kinase
MPETIRITKASRVYPTCHGRSAWARPLRRRFRAAFTAILCLPGLAPARAQEAIDAAPLRGSAFEGATLESYLAAFAQIDGHEIAAIVLMLGILCFAVVTAILLVRTRRRLAETETAARDEIMAARAEIDRVNVLLHSDPQILVAWAAADDQPEIIGDVTLVASADAPHRVLAFGSWLDAERASAMERLVETLRARGEGFAVTVTTLNGRPIEAEGHVIGGRAILRLRDISGVRRELTDLLARFQKQKDETEALRTLFEALPFPIWAREETGKLVLANPPYARAVDARDSIDAAQRSIELFDRGAREELLRAHEAAKPYTGRLPAIVGGARRTFDVLTFPVRRGSVGIGIDATEAEAMRAELTHMAQAHRRTLDQLPTGVAIFGSDQKLSFYNAAYRSLWDLDAAFLHRGPTDSAVLEQLRAARKLPEEQDFRQWKTQLHEAYRALEPKEFTWHLPDGRTMRVVTTPNLEGGVIYLFHDSTRRLDLERRFDALIKVQGETLDNLTEAVAVFGSDGRLRLFNPVFARLWKLDPAVLAERPHIEAVIAWCHALSGDNPIWPALRTTVTAIDHREPVTGHIDRRDGSAADCATVPLPDGATLVTFQDVTDSVNVERALRERNEALEEADKIKIDFVHHVSYELRSPLTNIIGFSHFLGDPVTGPLTEKQREYLGYIQVSTNALLAIINNILDLATIDAGAMKLNLGPVDIRKTMEDAAEGVQDRLGQSNIVLKIDVAPDIGSFLADERRIRQVLFNLLANAIGFSPAGETVTLSAQRHRDAIVFAVTDHGPGIPPEVKDKVFDWFETNSLGSHHRGTGLGLSLVRSFVELHGGAVTLDSAVGRGTTVTCTLPLGQSAERPAA